MVYVDQTHPDGISNNFDIGKSFTIETPDSFVVPCGVILDSVNEKITNEKRREEEDLNRDRGGYAPNIGAEEPRRDGRGQQAHRL